MNDFDKTFGLAFYNSFLKIELHCDKENMLISNICSFQKFWFTHLKKRVIGDGFNGACVLKIL